MMKPIRTYNTAEEAYIVRGLLASHGIDALVRDTGNNSVFPSLDGNDSSATLYVDESQLARAGALLASHGD